jgi:hypothetical protein
MHLQRTDDNGSKPGARVGRCSIAPLGNWARHLPAYRVQRLAERWLRLAERFAERHGHGRREGKFLEQVLLRTPGLRVLQRQLFCLRPQVHLQLLAKLYGTPVTRAPVSFSPLGSRARPVATRAAGWGPRVRREEALAKLRAGELRTLFTGAPESLRECSPNRLGPRVAARTLERVDLIIDRNTTRLRRSFREILASEEVAPASFVQRRISQTVRREERVAPIPQIYDAPARDAASPGVPALGPRETQQLGAMSAEAPLTSSGTLPAIVGQITDHVIAQLDRRMLAWRERMGRT